MKRSIVVHLNIHGDIIYPDYFDELLVAKTKVKNKNQPSNVVDSEEVVSGLVETLKNCVVSVTEDLGFSLDTASLDRISRRNGGYAWYNYLIYNQEDSSIHIRVDLRVSDHPSHPNLEEKNKIRLANMKQGLKRSGLPVDNLALLDTYCKKYDWGIQLFVGTNMDKNYTSPVTSFESFERIVKGKLLKIIKECSV